MRFNTCESGGGSESESESERGNERGGWREGGVTEEVEIAKKNKNPTLRMWGNTRVESVFGYPGHPLQTHPGRAQVL